MALTLHVAGIEATGWPDPNGIYVLDSSSRRDAPAYVHSEHDEFNIYLSVATQSSRERVWHIANSAALVHGSEARWFAQTSGAHNDTPIGHAWVEKPDEATTIATSISVVAYGGDGGYVDLSRDVSSEVDEAISTAGQPENNDEDDDEDVKEEEGDTSIDQTGWVDCEHEEEEEEFDTTGWEFGDDSEQPTRSEFYSEMKVISERMHCTSATQPVPLIDPSLALRIEDYTHDVDELERRMDPPSAEDLLQKQVDAYFRFAFDTLRLIDTKLEAIYRPASSGGASSTSGGGSSASGDAPAQSATSEQLLELRSGLTDMFNEEFKTLKQELGKLPRLDTTSSVSASSSAAAFPGMPVALVRQDSIESIPEDDEDAHTGFALSRPRSDGSAAASSAGEARYGSSQEESHSLSQSQDDDGEVENGSQNEEDIIHRELLASMVYEAPRRNMTHIEVALAVSAADPDNAVTPWEIVRLNYFKLETIGQYIGRSFVRYRKGTLFRIPCEDNEREVRRYIEEYGEWPPPPQRPPVKKRRPKRRKKMSASLQRATHEVAACAPSVETIPDGTVWEPCTISNRRITDDVEVVDCEILGGAGTGRCVLAEQIAVRFIRPLEGAVTSRKRQSESPSAAERQARAAKRAKTKRSSASAAEPAEEEHLIAAASSASAAEPAEEEHLSAASFLPDPPVPPQGALPVIEEAAGVVVVPKAPPRRPPMPMSSFSSAGTSSRESTDTEMTSSGEVGERLLHVSRRFRDGQIYEAWLAFCIPIESDADFLTRMLFPASSSDEPLMLEYISEPVVHALDLAALIKKQDSQVVKLKRIAKSSPAFDAWTRDQGDDGFACTHRTGCYVIFEAKTLRGSQDYRVFLRAENNPGVGRSEYSAICFRTRDRPLLPPNRLAQMVYENILRQMPLTCRPQPGKLPHLPLALDIDECIIRKIKENGSTRECNPPKRRTVTLSDFEVDDFSGGRKRIGGTRKVYRRNLQRFMKRVLRTHCVFIVSAGDPGHVRAVLDALIEAEIDGFASLHDNIIDRVFLPGERRVAHHSGGFRLNVAPKSLRHCAIEAQCDGSEKMWCAVDNSMHVWEARDHTRIIHVPDYVAGEDSQEEGAPVHGAICGCGRRAPSCLSSEGVLLSVAEELETQRAVFTRAFFVESGDASAAAAAPTFTFKDDREFLRDKSWKHWAAWQTRDSRGNPWSPRHILDIGKLRQPGNALEELMSTRERARAEEEQRKDKQWRQWRKDEQARLHRHGGGGGGGGSAAGSARFRGGARARGSSSSAGQMRRNDDHRASSHADHPPARRREGGAEGARSDRFRRSAHARGNSSSAGQMRRSDKHRASSYDEFAGGPSARRRGGGAEEAVRHHGGQSERLRWGGREVSRHRAAPAAAARTPHHGGSTGRGPMHRRKQQRPRNLQRPLTQQEERDAEQLKRRKAAILHARKRDPRKKR